jgi:hypothetical protein
MGLLLSPGLSCCALCAALLIPVSAGFLFLLLLLPFLCFHVVFVCSSACCLGFCGCSLPGCFGFVLAACFLYSVTY